MNLKHTTRSLLLSAALLFPTAALADAPNAAAPTKSKAAAPGAKADDKKEDKDKKDEKNDKKDDKKPGDLAKADDKKPEGHGDREARKAKEHEDERNKLAAMLKHPADEALRQELRRHAERMARLTRIKTLAAEAKDQDTIDRATKLIAKEDARHEKWMGVYASQPTAQVDTKGGAK